MRLIAFVFLMIGLIGLWHMDVARSAEFMINGFFRIEGDKIFHIGLWSVLGALIALGAIGVLKD